MDQDKLFYAKLADLADRASSGQIVGTAFLTPEEIVLADAWLMQSGAGLSWGFYGGYADAERRMLLIRPDYLPEDCVEERDWFSVLEIRISGYVNLDHRSYLGALMALGIKRETLGDILCLQDGAVLFATPAVSDFLLSDPPPLVYVGRDKVKVLPADPAKAADYQRIYEERTGIVASMRLDGIVAEFGGLSREKAKAAIQRGEVMYNHRQASDPAKICTPGDILSLRGCGKFKIKDFETTRKERVRLTVLVYR
ncbi:MAG: RNA-binding protein [Eubacteriales bacterium]